MTKIQMLQNNLALFIEAIHISNMLNIDSVLHKGDDSFFIIKVNNAREEDVYFVELSVEEVIEKVTSLKVANDLVDILEGNRSAHVLHKITRIVGYYSRVHNWNKSKTGELEDRQKGIYII